MSIPILFRAAVLLLALAAAGCQPKTGPEANAAPPGTPTPTPPPARIHFAGASYDFGTVREGDTVTHAFSFTNAGKVPLVIHSATASCGCTVPQKPDQPLAPGDTGMISVAFYSAGRLGEQQKAIAVVANTEPSVTTLVLSGTVQAQPGRPAGETP
jgi:hypothetical protein